MTDTSAMTNADAAIDIVDQPDGVGADLNRRTDAFLEDNAGRRPVTSVRDAAREDFAVFRAGARDRALLAREQVAANPRKSVLYALGAGVVLGLILAR